MSGSKTYEDEVKQKSREKQREFIKNNLLIKKRTKDIRVVCFPGAEVDGEEAIEVKEVYDKLGIPRENIIGLEANLERAERLQRVDLGIVVKPQMDLDFFSKTDKKFDIISLDYTGYRDEAKWQALHQIAGNQLLDGHGILATNYSAKRESRKNQGQMVALQLDSFVNNKNMDGGEDIISELAEAYENGDKLDLSELRDNLIERTLMIMRMGKSALFPIDILSTHPFHEGIQKEMERIERETREKGLDGDSNFMFKNRYESGMGNKGVSHFHSFSNRSANMEALAYHIGKANNISANLSNFFVHYLVDMDMRAQFPRSVERYSYTSNKNTNMEMDLMAFTPASFIYRAINNEVFYDPKNGKIRVLRMKGGKLLREADKIYAGKHMEIPERIYLGSSFVHPGKNKKKKNEINGRGLEVISKDGAVDLLKSGVEPKEIMECYSGFSINQLAAYKAHYVTMGKEYTSDK